MQSPELPPVRQVSNRQMLLTMAAFALACPWLVLGFGLFGKNLLNVWGIVAGVWLYARCKREPFAKHSNAAFFGTALAPIFSEILFSSALTLPTSLPLAVATTVLLGFVLAPAAAHLFHARQGHSLCNMGFVAGLLGTLTVAVCKSYGFVPDPVFIRTQGNNRLLGGLLVGLFTAMTKVRNSAAMAANRDPAIAAALRAPDAQIHAIDLSFAALNDPAERTFLNQQPTTFVLTDDAVDRLRAAAGRIIDDSPEFQRLLEDIGGRVVAAPAGRSATIRQP